MARAILHVDLDQFYAAVEVLDEPSLKGLPVIVGGRPGGRGVVSTASYEARAFGVHSAMSSAMAARLCPQAVWRTPRMSRYAEKSREVRRVFERYTEQIEPLSLDEAFLDVTGSQQLFGTPERMAQQIKAAIRAETGLVASAGVAENKFLAKVASDLRKPDGLVVVPSGREAAAAFLAPLPLSRLWGVGPKTAERLRELGLQTIGDVARADPEWLARRLGESLAAHLLQLAHGLDERPVETDAAAKSVGRENTFPRDLFALDEMERELLACADDVAARLREQRLLAGGVTLKVKFADFRQITRAVQLDPPTDLAEPLYLAVVKMLRERVERGGQGVRLLGLSAQHLLLAGDAPPTLFPDENQEKKRSAAAAIDRLRERFGDNAVTFGRLLEPRAGDTGTPPDRPGRPGRTGGDEAR